MLNPVFDQFVKKSPISVMARGMMERVLDPQQLDEWFETTADQQYTRELLFSTTFAIMSQVVRGSHPSVHAAYQAKNKIKGSSLLLTPLFIHEDNRPSGRFFRRNIFMNFRIKFITFNDHLDICMRH